MNGQVIAIPIIRIPDIKNQLLTPILSANNPDSINPTGIAKDIMLPVRENTRPKYSGIILSWKSAV